MFDPLTIGVGTLLILAFKKQANTSFGVLTPQREEIYNNALQHLADPAKLRKLAEEFDKQGLKVQGNLLRKRAAWRSRTEEQRDQHDAIFAKAMASTNVAGIRQVAQAFEAMTATQKAGMLYDRARIVAELAAAKTSQESSMNIHTPQEQAKSGTNSGNVQASPTETQSTGGKPAVN